MLNELKNVGLTDKEARVYLAMLELGPASVLEIAAKAGINRPTAYVQIEALKHSGLASTQTKGKKQLFIAESPAQLEQLLAMEQKKVEQRRDSLKNMLPDLTAMFNLGDEKPVVRYFEGKNGIQHLMDVFLKSYKEKKGDEIVSLTNLGAFLEVFPDHLRTYSERRAQKKIHSRVIYTGSEPDFLPYYDSTKIRYAKYVEESKLPIHVDLTIYGNNMSVVSLKNRVFGTLIESKEMTDSFRAIFEYVWNSIPEKKNGAV